MTLEDQEPTPSVLRAIEQRDVDYEYFMATNGEAIAQLDGEYLIRHAFRRGWEIGVLHQKGQNNEV